jgi:hypothetical protein
MRCVRYIGHVVSEDEVETGPEKVSKVKDWPTPKNGEDIRSFLGFVGYYRNFIKNIAKIARPLIDVMATGRKSRSKKPNSNWTWTSDQEEAFQTLKDKIISPPIWTRSPETDSSPC